MIPLVLPVELPPEPVLEGAAEALPPVDPVLVLELPPELPQAASSATPPAPAPISSCRRGQVNVKGAALLSDKATSGKWLVRE